MGLVMEKRASLPPQAILYGMSRAFVLTLVMACACNGGAPTDPNLPRRGVTIEVDSVVYHLKPTQYGYEVNMTVTIVNDGDSDVYLSKYCGSWRLGRADGGTEWIELGAYACIEEPRRDPVTVRAGTRFTETYHLSGSYQRQRNPPITMREYTGSMVFHRTFSNPSGTNWLSLHSDPFIVRPPLANQ